MRHHRQQWQHACTGQYQQNPVLPRKCAGPQEDQGKHGHDDGVGKRRPRTGQHQDQEIGGEQQQSA